MSFVGWTIHMQPWRVLKRQTKRDSSRQQLLHQIMSPSSNSISFSVFNLVLKTTSLQLFSFLTLFETSIVVTSRWPIAEGSSNARFWPRKMGRRWLPSTQRKTLEGRSAWLGGHRRRKTATRGKRVSFAFFTSLAVWLAFFSRARCHTTSGKWEVFLGNWLGTSSISRRNCHHERHRFLRLRCDQRRRIRGIHLERKIPTPKLDLQNFRTPC